MRELRNVLERSWALSPSSAFRDLRLRVDGSGPGAGQSPQLAEVVDTSLPFKDAKERWNDHFERRYLAWLLRRADGNISKAARDADMDRKYLHKLLRKYGIGSDEPAEE